MSVGSIVVAVHTHVHMGVHDRYRVLILYLSVCHMPDTMPPQSYYNKSSLEHIPCGAMQSISSVPMHASDIKKKLP